MDFVESIANLLSKNEESSWQKASASLDVSAKVYGYRVDSVHSDTFRFLGGLNRNKKDDNQKEEEIPDDQSQDNKKKAKINRGQNTLEQNINKLNLTKYDLENEVDPLFSAMTSKFNESNASGLLLNTIPMDTNLNYILESKKVDENNQKENNNNNDIIENNINLNNDSLKSDSIKDLDSSSENKLGFNKEKEVKNLAKNLKNKFNQDEISDDLFPQIPIKCSNNIDSLPDEIQNLLKDFKQNNSVDDFVQLKICPGLDIFRKSRDIFPNAKEINSEFVKAFKDEINNADKNNIIEGVENIIPEENEIEVPDDLGDNPDIGEQGITQDEVRNVEEPTNINNITSFMQNNSFSTFKYEDILQYAGQFGGGGVLNLPQFNTFTNNFNKMENNKINKNTIYGKKEKSKIVKKEEKLFDFDEENEIDIMTFFDEPKTKKINNKNLYYGADYENKGKTRCYYHFDRDAAFRLYTIQNLNIFNKDMEEDLNNNTKENMDNSGDIANSGMEIQGNENDFENGGTNNNTFFQDEKEAEKNFGKLYRRFDIRSLKNKIWNSYNSLGQDDVDFKNVVTNMSKDMSNDELFSISTPTCFVCMLHLCNEKNLILEQTNVNTFKINSDIDGEKSKKTLLSKEVNLEDDLTKTNLFRKKGKKSKKDDGKMDIDE